LYSMYPSSVAYRWHEALPEHEDAVVQGDQGVTGDQRPGSSSVLPQRHDRQQECHTDEGGAGLQDPRGYETQRERFVLLLQYREQHNGGGDTREPGE
jgi:hypothetical protein